MISQLNDEQLCTKVVQLNEAQQKQRLRLFSRISLIDKCEVLENQRKEFFILKEQNINLNKNYLSYCSLLIAIDRFEKKQSDIDKKTLKFDSKFINKQSQKERLLSYWSVIKELKEKHSYSFRKIQEYLLTYFKLEVAHSTIYETWKQIEYKNNGEKNVK